MLALHIPIMDVTDTIVSNVNWIVSVGFWEACVTDRIGSVVNWIIDVESSGACVRLWIADVEVPIVDDKLSEINFETWL